jgi:hypothetical protein
MKSVRHLVQILLPTRDNDGETFPTADFENVARELTDRFGGMTAYTRAPAEGRWKQDAGTEHDDIVVVEVMDDALDRSWWRRYRQELEVRFQQEVLIIRAQEIEIL